VTSATACVTVLVVRLSRRTKVAPELRGERFWGYRVTDRGRAYTWDPAWRQQVCGAHLLRDIEAMIERGGRSHALGEALHAQARQMCHGWHRVRDGTLAPTTCASSLWPVRPEVERWLEASQTGGVPKTAGACRARLTRRQAWWTFVRHPEVEPTNHAAERAIRPRLLGRQGRFGTQRPEGSRVVETMMTTVATLKQQHRHILDDVIAACAAALRHQPAPS
jgi:transposase